MVTSDGFDSVAANEPDSGMKPLFRRLEKRPAAFWESQAEPQEKVKPEGNRPGLRAERCSRYIGHHAVVRGNRITDRVPVTDVSSVRARWNGIEHADGATSMSCRSRLTRAFGERLLILAVSLAGASPALAQREAETLSASFRKAAEKMLPSVVAVRPVGLVGRGVPYGILGRPVFPGEPGGMPGHPGEPDRLPGGSGVVVDAARGLILTSDQAIAGASRVVVVYEDGREVETDRVVRDPQTELVVLAVDPKTVRVKEAEWGSSEALQLGDWVLSIGRSSGRAGTVSAGIVSSRAAGAQDDLLRTDAVIGSAGSGGPLIDLEGRIVGINRARLDPRGWPDGFGLAIPAERARRCVSDLAEFGQVRRGYLGLMIAPGGGLDLTGQASGLVVTGVTRGARPLRSVCGWATGSSLLMAIRSRIGRNSRGPSTRCRSVRSFGSRSSVLASGRMSR